MIEKTIVGKDWYRGKLFKIGKHIFFDTLKYLSLAGKSML
jgi:hypothetical protein